MHKAVILLLLIFLPFLSIPLYALDPSETATADESSFNPRDDYRFGVGTMVGGPYGLVGLVVDMNWYSTFNAEMGVGSGIYYDSYAFLGRYFILDNPFTPYIGAGLAYWDSTANGPKTAQNSQQAVRLGLVKIDGTQLKSGILLLPLAGGIHYISENGLCLFADFEFLVSAAKFSAAPYGSIGFQWFF